MTYTPTNIYYIRGDGFETAGKGFQAAKQGAEVANPNSGRGGGVYVIIEFSRAFNIGYNFYICITLSVYKHSILFTY